MSLKSVVNKMLLASNESGTIRIKRFSKSKFDVKRFSDDGTVIDEEVVVDESAPEGTEEIAETVPSEDVVVFSDAEEETDEVVLAVDGGSTEEVVEQMSNKGFSADTKQFTNLKATFTSRGSGMSPNEFSEKMKKAGCPQSKSGFSSESEAKKWIDQWKSKAKSAGATKAYTVDMDEAEGERRESRKDFEL